MTQRIDLGNGWSYSFFTENGVEGHTGLIILGPAAPQCPHKKFFDEMEGQSSSVMCGGGINFTNSLIAAKEGRPMWKVESWEPLTISPSIKCECEGQHGHIQNGVYV